MAAVGVLGTLISPVITVRLSARLQQSRLEAERDLALDARRHDELKSVQSQKRSCYVTLNAAARRYRVVQMNYLHALQEERLTSEERQELEDARRSYGAAVAEAQMTAAPKVLDEMETIFSALSRSYRGIRRLELRDPEPDGSYGEVRAQLWERWKALRDAMRVDLGVE